MPKETLAIIGAGSVGSALALAGRSAGHTIAAVVSKRASSARRLAHHVHARAWGSGLHIIPPDVSFIMLAVPDSALAKVVDDLAWILPKTRKRRVIVHTSGVRTSDELRPLGGRNVILASMHPIRSFPSVHAVGSLRDEWFGVEGSRKNLPRVRSFIRSLGGRSVDIPKSKKTLYHIACTFASNYPMALMEATEELAKAARLKGGILPLHRLMTSSIQNGHAHGAMEALTGPIVRGDAETMRTHRKEIQRTLPRLLPLFDELILFTSLAAERKGRISPTEGRALRKTISRKVSTRKER